MSEWNSKPVILLAFANSSDSPLPQLAEEYHRLEAILRKAEQRGHCELVLAPYATVDDIVDTFQDPARRGRVAIFHYAGHAGSYSLLLDGSGGRPAVAHAGGLAAFLGHQSGIQLVFLNGCSTQLQAQGLLDAGVSVVIATAQAIVDEVALEFAARFYQFLADGDALGVAFDKAQAVTQAVWGSDIRQLYAAIGEDPRLADRWPWNRYVRPGCEAALRWNLPDAATDPLFGLPPIPAQYYRQLPDNPFRGLTWFAKEHAALFYGRGYQIRELYQQINGPGTPPLILFYGQSGVGKSSLLAAGLAPRLENSHTIIYCRREPEAGLLGSLQAVLPGWAAGMPLAEAWVAFEQRERRPLLLIVDQAEEVFTRPSSAHPHELADFFAVLQPLSADPERWPQGRMILGFRKEWLAEIKRQVEDHRLPYTELFLQRLDRAGVREAIEGPTRSPELQAKYHLRIAGQLSHLIADDLLDDPGSPVAPMLQILLTKLWERARQENYAAPTFDRGLYQKLLKEQPGRAGDGPAGKGIGLQDIVDQQLAELSARQPAHTASGLVLDLLVYHTTALGTAEQRTLSQLRQTYANQAAALPDLLATCRDLYLLADPVEIRPDAEPASRLAHDTLAPMVRARFDESDAPGQRARRILENRAVGWRNGLAGDTLDDADLALVESGRDGMRAWTADEARLVQASREEHLQRIAEKERIQQALESARQRAIEQALEIARQSAARARQRAWIIRVLSAILAIVVLWRGLVLYRDLYFRLSDWQPIAGNNFPAESVAYAIAFANPTAGPTDHLYCVATFMVGVGCSRNGDTWNFYQEGFPTGAVAPATIGGFSGNMRGITALAFDATNPDVMHAFSLDGHFYRSSNAGQTWTASPDALPAGMAVSTLAAQDRLVIAVAHQAPSGGDQRLFVSDDGGQSWRLALGPGDSRVGQVYDAALYEPAGGQGAGILAASSSGLWYGIHAGQSWLWQPTGFTASSRLLAQASANGQSWAVVTYDPEQRRGALWLGPVTALQALAEWEGEPIRLALDPRLRQAAEAVAAPAYVLLAGGDVVKISATGQTSRIKGLSHPLFGQSYDLAVVPRPDRNGVWLLLGHRRGLMRYTREP